MRAAALILAAVAPGCTVTATAGEPCPRVRINEIMTANSNFEILDNVSSDWFELVNDDDVPAELGGFVLVGHSEVEPAYLFSPDFRMEAGAFAVFIAATYDDASLPYPVVGFDFNDDSDSLQLRASSALDYTECDAVAVPDQHQDFSWERDPDEPEAWCDAASPSPGEANDSCLCEVTDDCS